MNALFYKEIKFVRKSVKLIFVCVQFLLRPRAQFCKGSNCMGRSMVVRACTVVIDVTLRLVASHTNWRPHKFARRNMNVLLLTNQNR